MTIEDFPEEGFRECHPLKFMVERYDHLRSCDYICWLEKKDATREHKKNPTKKNRERLRIARGSQWKNSVEMGELQDEFRHWTGRYIGEYE